MAEVLLLVTHIEDDGCTFSAQKHTATSNADIESITARLQLHARSTGNKVDPAKAKHASSLKGKVYAAQYLDDTWYRCRFLFPTGEAKCLVQYIDYGNCEEILIANLMDIPSDISDSVIPSMAERYRLHGIKINADDIDKAVQYIESASTGSYMKAQVLETAHVTQPSSPHSVILFDDNGNSVGDKLVELGYAVEEKAQTKTGVILSSPPVPHAQLFKNPLLSSPKPITRSYDVSNVIRPSGRDTPVDCDRCETYKETAEKMRLHMIRLRLKLEESEKLAVDLKKSEQFWKEKHDDLQKIDADRHLQPSENEPSINTISDADFTLNHSTIGAVTDMISGCASGSMLQKPSHNTTCALGTDNRIKKDYVKKRDADCELSSPHEPVDHCKGKNGTFAIEENSTVDLNIENVSKYQTEEDVTVDGSKVDSSIIPTETMSGFMKRVIMPALGYFKTITNSNNMVESCAAYETDLNEIVSKIKACVNKDQNCKEANQLGLTTRRHTLVENLKQSLQHSVKALAKDVDEMENIIAGHTKGLHDIFSNFTDGNHSGKVHDKLLVSDIEAFMKEVKHKSDLSTLCKMIMDGLYQQFDKFSLYKTRRNQFQQILADITAYEGHERTIKDLLNENRGIRRQKQIIRLLVTEIKNLEEQIEDATSSELKELEMEIDASREKLSAERLKIHESFEARWHLMGNLADMVEKFYPELLIEYKELGISEYILEEGILLKGMEIDHFDIDENKGEDCMNSVVYSTKYRGDEISLHKCPIGKMLLTEVLHKMSVYSNLDCEHTLLPMGIFASSEVAYVMVSKPPVAASPIYKAEALNDEAVEIVLKDIATALLALHENGLTHGMISKECVMYASDAAIPRGFLSVPNFFADQDGSIQTLANDIAQYGMLAKSLTLKNCPPKLKNIMNTCANESNAITMRNVLELF